MSEESRVIISVVDGFDAINFRLFFVSEGTIHHAESDATMYHLRQQQTIVAIRSENAGVVRALHKKV